MSSSVGERKKHINHYVSVCMSDHDILKAYHVVLRHIIPKVKRGIPPHGGLRLHMSAKRIPRMDNGTNTRTSRGNATGVWYAFDADWIDLQEGSFARSVGRFAYDVHVDPKCLTTSIRDEGADTKVLVIRDLMDAIAFQKRYGSDAGWSWPAVRKDLAGFEVRFQPPETLRVLAELQRRVFGRTDDEAESHSRFQRILDFKNTSRHWMSWLHDSRLHDSPLHLEHPSRRHDASVAHPEQGTRQPGTGRPSVQRLINDRVHVNSMQTRWYETSPTAAA